jgi:hypothetical protein
MQACLSEEDLMQVAGNIRGRNARHTMIAKYCFFPHTPKSFVFDLMSFSSKLVCLKIYRCQLFRPEGIVG